MLTFILFTFHASRRRRKMYCGHARPCVCLSVCSRMPTLLHGPGCNVGCGRGCPLVVHYWVDLQLVHRLRCYGNITRTRNVSECMLVVALCLVIMAAGMVICLGQGASDLHVVQLMPLPSYHLLLY